MSWVGYIGVVERLRLGFFGTYPLPVRTEFVQRLILLSAHALCVVVDKQRNVTYAIG